MSEEIVRRLMQHKDKSFLKESMNIQHRLLEAEDDEEEELDTEIVDDEFDPDEEFEEPEVEDEVDDAPKKRPTPPSFDDDEVDMDSESGSGDEDTPASELDIEDHTGDNTNPLDNIYAVNYQIGEEVTVGYTNGTSTGLAGTIDGYDEEGFYRIKWENGLTTNGISDLALLDKVDGLKENKCVCGCSEFVNEDKELVCDRCGRKMKESFDILTLADKSRPKGKKLIRSIPHEMSTADRPNIPDISEAIKSALSGSKINEEEEEFDEGLFDKLIDELQGQFWTKLPELQEDISDLGYGVDDINGEYVVVYAEDEEGEEHQLMIPIGGTARTITLDFSKSKEL